MNIFMDVEFPKYKADKREVESVIHSQILKLESWLDHREIVKGLQDESIKYVPHDPEEEEAPFVPKSFMELQKYMWKVPNERLLAAEADYQQKIDQLQNVINGQSEWLGGKFKEQDENTKQLVIETNTAGELYTDEQLKPVHIHVKCLQTDFDNYSKKTSSMFLV